MAKFFKVLFSIILFIAAIPAVDWVIKFFQKNTHKYTKPEKFDL